MSAVIRPEAPFLSRDAPALASPRLSADARRVLAGAALLTPLLFR